MARLAGVICTSHVPAIGGAIARKAQQDPYWKPFFDGFGPVRGWLEKARPDVAIIVYNDHGLNFFLDKMPTFAIGAAPEYPTADEGWGLPTLAPFPGVPRISWPIIESLVADEFDVTTCQEMLVDHAIAIPMQLLWPAGPPWPVRIVPVCVNTVQHPLPSAARCLKLGQAIGRAVAALDPDLTVAVVGTGGLSHQLDGQRAGFINREFDMYCLDRLVHDPDALTVFSNEQIVERAGTQGVELLMWIVARGTLSGPIKQVHRHYHIPISNTASGILVLEPDIEAADRGTQGWAA